MSKPQSQTLQDIYGEMYQILQHFGAMSDVLAPLGSASDGEWPDEDVLIPCADIEKSY